MPNSPWPKRKRQPDPAFGQKREAVLEAAARLFVERGYENTSLNELAAALNVTKPTLYYYFESKEQILGEIIERSHREHVRIHEEVTASRIPGLEKVRLFCESYVALLGRDVGKCQVKVNWRTFPPEFRESVRSKMAWSDDLLRRLVREGIEDGSIADCDPKLAAFTIFGALNWMAWWHREDGELDAGALADGMVGLLMQGLEPR